MAKVKFYKNMFEDNCDIIDVAVGSKIEDLINKYSPVNPYEADLVECYDPDEDKTYYAPLSDAEEPSVVITVNEQIISPDYVIQENDLVNVVYIPANKGNNWWIGLIVGIAVGIASVVSCGAALGLSATALTVLGSFGGVIGAAVGTMVGQTVDNALPGNGTSTTEGPQELKQNPAIRGANNQALVGGSYPFVIGKHLITPFVVGTPITSYEGTHGKDARIKMLLCAGYGPLKLTDFKLDETFLAYNGGTRNPTGKGTLLRGTLSGNDILDLWKENDIKIEIIQHKKGESHWRGNIYPTVKFDKQINANCLFIADKALTSSALVTYKGASFPTNFRTNNVYFTESCPKAFTINFIANSGLFRTRSHTHTKDDNSHTTSEYSSIPIWYAIQYRYYNDSNKPSDPMGHDYNNWTTVNCYLNSTFNNGSGVDSATEDANAHAGNDYAGSMNEVYGNWMNNKVLTNFGKLSGKDGNVQMRIPVTVDLTNTASKCFESGNSIKGVEIRVIRVSPSYINETSSSSSSEDEDHYGPWSYSDTVGVESIVTEVFDEEHYKQTGRVSPVYAIPNDHDLEKFCYIAISAKADSNGYINNALQKISCTAEAFAPQWDSTHKKWLPEGVRAKTKYVGYFDKSKTDLTLLSDPAYRAEHDADRVNISNYANEVELTYDSPDLSDSEKDRLAMCELGRARREGKIVIDPVTGEEKRVDLNWLPVKEGSNFAELIKNLIFTGSSSSNCYLADKYKFYNGNSSASAAMLAMVGSQSGLAGLGYENINLASFGEWAEACIGVKDGSTNNDGSPLSVNMCANGYVFKPSKLENLLAQLVTTGRAMYTYDSSGKIKVIMDKPVDYPVGVLSDQNCESSQNTYSYDELPAGLSITFNDENDGYESNSLFCWADGNSYSNYRGQVVPYSIPFVTNPAQSWSLGRYFLASRLLNRSVLTRKTGPEGCTYELGDVVIVQSANLLIGEDSSARIQKVIKVGNKIHGVVTDAVYTYDDKISMGITILQPKKYKSSKVVTLELAPVGTTVLSEGVTYVQDKGLVNFALFKEPIEFSDNSYTTTEDQYNFTSSDVCLFGNIKYSNEKYRIIKIKQESPTSYTQTLLKYDEKVYNYGAELPALQSYRRIPNVSRNPVELSEVPNNLVELNKQNNNTNNSINDRLDALYANRVINLYRRSDTPLTTDQLPQSYLSYDFSKNTIRWHDPSARNGWEFDYSIASAGTGTMFFTSATAFGKGLTATIPPKDWTPPIAFGANGEPGSSGINGYTIFAEVSAITVNDIDADGTPDEMWVSDKIHVEIDGEPVDFTIGEIPYVEGFDFDVQGDTVIIHGQKNKNMAKNGFIQIPLFAKKVVERSYLVDENGLAYMDEEGNSYGYFEFSNEDVKYELYVSYAKAHYGDKGDTGAKGDKGDLGPQGPYYWGVSAEDPVSTEDKPLVPGCWYLNSVHGNIWVYSKNEKEPWIELKPLKYTDSRVKACINDIFEITKKNPTINDELIAVEKVWCENLITNEAFIKELTSDKAFIKKLFANEIKVTEDDDYLPPKRGILYGGERYNSSGYIINKSKTGFFIDTAGRIKGSMIGDRGNIIIGELAGETLNYGDSTSTSGNGSQNILLGDKSGQKISSGWSNICIGEASGYYLTTGDKNICIGSGSDVDEYGNWNILLHSGRVKGSENIILRGTTDSHRDCSNNIVIGNSQANGNEHIILGANNYTDTQSSSQVLIGNSLRTTNRNVRLNICDILVYTPIEEYCVKIGSHHCFVDNDYNKPYNYNSLENFFLMFNKDHYGLNFPVYLEWDSNYREGWAVIGKTDSGYSLTLGARNHKTVLALNQSNRTVTVNGSVCSSFYLRVL